MSALWRNQVACVHCCGRMAGEGLKISYHNSHEQFAPSQLLKRVQAAEAAGFDAAFSSDHFHPWSERQGQRDYSWA